MEASNMPTRRKKSNEDEDAPDIVDQSAAQAEFEARAAAEEAQSATKPKKKRGGKRQREDVESTGDALALDSAPGFAELPADLLSAAAEEAEALEAAEDLAERRAQDAAIRAANSKKRHKRFEETEANKPSKKKRNDNFILSVYDDAPSKRSGASLEAKLQPTSSAVAFAGQLLGNNRHNQVNLKATSLIFFFLRILRRLLHAC